MTFNGVVAALLVWLLTSFAVAAIRRWKLWAVLLAAYALIGLVGFFVLGNAAFAPEAGNGDPLGFAVLLMIGLAVFILALLGGFVGWLAQLWDERRQRKLGTD